MGILPVGLSVAQDARRDIPCGDDLLRYPVCHILSLGTHSDPFGVPKIITFGDQRGTPLQHVLGPPKMVTFGTSLGTLPGTP